MIKKKQLKDPSDKLILKRKRRYESLKKTHSVSAVSIVDELCRAIGTPFLTWSNHRDIYCIIDKKCVGKIERICYDKEDPDGPIALKISSSPIDLPKKGLTRGKIHKRKHL